MLIYESIDLFNPPKNGISVFIGKADALHLGHIALINETISLADSTNTEPAVLSLFPDKKNPLFEGANYQYILTPEERLTILSNWPLEHVIYHVMTKGFTSISAIDFIEKILYKQMKVRGVVVGWDYRFGNKCEGNIEMLEKYSKDLGFSLQAIDPVMVKDMPVKTTLIRELLLDGDYPSAQSFLGYPFFVSGRVIKGRGIGNSLGFPTANIDVPHDKLLPRQGVSIVRIPFDDNIYWGLASIGTKPTILENGPLTMEVWIQGFDRNITNANIKVEFFKFLREELKLQSLQELKLQIEKDVCNLDEYISGFGLL